MQALERLIQFVIIFAIFLVLLFGIKYSFDVSDYVIPSFQELLEEAKNIFHPYLFATLNTFVVAVIGHAFATLLAIIIASLASLKSWAGALAKTASYNLQAYPVVAVSPIIFLFFGDGLASRIIIAGLICYFPLLLSFIGIFSVPVPEVEHFFKITGRLRRGLMLKIRTLENLEKVVTVVVGSGTMAMVGTIVAEFLAATNGIGYSIRKALYQSNLARIIIALFLIGLVSSCYLATLEGMGKWLKKRIIG